MSYLKQNKIERTFNQYYITSNFIV